MAALRTLIAAMSEKNSCGTTVMMWKLLMHPFMNWQKLLSEKNWIMPQELPQFCFNFSPPSAKRVLERLDCFAHSLKYGKSEAILIPKYIREDGPFYSSTLNRDNQTKFAQLHSNAFARKLNEKKAEVIGNRGDKSTAKSRRFNL